MSTPLNAVGVIADIAGLELTDDDCDFLQASEISGVILFSRNYQDNEQLRSLTASLRALRPDLLISVDQEGGRVQRFRSGFTRLPPMLRLGELWQSEPERALRCAVDWGWLMATELAAHGVDLSYAPVLDLDRGCSDVIGDRAFSSSVEGVIALSEAWLRGVASVGMKAVVKHFPGHGAVAADSHVSLPYDDRSWSELVTDMMPFAHLIAQKQVQGVMPAHVVYRAVDPNHTAGFSTHWLQSVLRQQLSFSGVIFSDDLSMVGAASGGDYHQRSQQAVAAGANALLVCNDRAAATEVVAAVKAMCRPHLDLSDWQLSPALQQQAFSALQSERVRHIQASMALHWQYN